MQNEHWKETLQNLTIDELRNVRSFVEELIQRLETEVKAEIKEETKKEVKEEAKEESDPVIVYPPETPEETRERRTEKRFDLKTNGTCSFLDKGLNDFSNEEIPITIKDVSQHGIRFVTNRPVLPSNHLIVKFSLSSAGTTGNLYRKPQKKIYVEVRRVLMRATQSGGEYDIGALSIDEGTIKELQEETNGFEIIKKRCKVKEDLKIMVLYVKETQCRVIENILLKQGYIVYAANQKHNAMSMLRKNKCDLLVTEFESAKMNDYELLKDVKTEFAGLGIILEIDLIDTWMDLLSFCLDGYLLKGFNERELNIVVESVLKKVLYKNMFRQYIENGKRTNQNLLIICRGDIIRKQLYEISNQKGLKSFFVTDTEHAFNILNMNKIDFMLLDTAITGEKGLDFVTKIKKDFPRISITIFSENILERSSYLMGGVDNFIMKPANDMQKLKQYWDMVITQRDFCL
ncbi:MAG: response regulator [Planctomycetes bacterium]|nr:response regulator [Planctomycetota bacterium]